jgi:hypothetical protein
MKAWECQASTGTDSSRINRRLTPQQNPYSNRREEKRTSKGSQYRASAALPSRTRTVSKTALLKRRLVLATYNDNARPFVWVKTAEEILANVTRFCLRTSEAGH